MVKNLPASTKDAGGISPIAGSGGSLEKGKTTHSSVLAWRIPWTVQPMGMQRVGHD